MNKISKAWQLAVAVTVLAVMATSGCQARDRAGGNADAPVTELKFAVNGGPGTQITAWANEVDQLSRGTVKITFIQDARAGQPDYEAGTIDDVRAGTVDLAWVGARAFDQVGVTSFQPLLAPLLIDSLELQGKVFDAGIPQQMLTGVEKLDLVGIGILPGPLRKVLGINQPFTTPADFKDQVVGIQASGVADHTIRTLKGTPKPVTTGASLDGLDAYDQQLWSIQGNHYVDQAKYVTGNLNLWPRPLVIIANRAAYDRLTEDQQAIMAAATAHSIPIAMEAERTADTNAITALCTAGLTFAPSTDADLKAFEKALTPVYTTIRKHPASSAWLDQITTIKQTLHRAPDTAECTNTPTDQPAATRYDGTYEMSIVWPTVKTQDARCVGGPEGGPEGATYDLVLDKGTLRVWVRVGSPDAERELGLEVPFEIFKDQLAFMEGDGTRIVFDFTYEDGKFTLSNQRGGDCGGRAIFTTKPWIRQ
jgi:TRAP-type C4-dicarboxylate transport system substrate-binding protein